METQASLENLPARLEVFGAAQTWLNFLEQSGYHGIQLPPQHTLPTHMYRFDSLADAGVVTSFYQPGTYRASLRELAYRTTPGLPTPAGPIADLQSRLMQRGARQRAPTVFAGGGFDIRMVPSWLHTDYRKLRDRGLLGPLVYRLGSKGLREWGVREDMHASEAAELIMRERAARGFDGVALDLGDLAAKGPSDKMEALVGRLALRGGLSGSRDYGSSEVVISLAVDTKEDGEEVRKIMTGKLADTRIGRLLVAIRDGVRQRGQAELRTTIKARPATFRKLGGYRVGNKAVCTAIEALFQSQRTSRLRS